MDISGAIIYLTTKLTWVLWWLSGKELTWKSRLYFLVEFILVL